MAWMNAARRTGYATGCFKQSRAGGTLVIGDAINTVVLQGYLKWDLSAEWSGRIQCTVK